MTKMCAVGRLTETNSYQSRPDNGNIEGNDADIEIPPRAYV